MSCQRQFLEWKQPVLVSAGDYLVKRYFEQDQLNMEGVVVVVPGRRAGQRLMEILLGRADHDSLCFLPPQIVTGGMLPELLYELKRPLASDVVQRLAWTRALRETPAETVRRVSPRLPEPDAHSQWQHLADTLRRLHRELAAEGLSFVDVAGDQGDVGPHFERPRWRALDAIAQNYLAILDELGVWDQQTARRVAVHQHECTIDRDLVLVGMADMNRVLRQMLAQVADRVTALIAAPGSYADRFDESGCLIPGAWQDAALDVRDEQIQLAQDAPDQAEEVVRCLAKFGTRFAVGEITIGAPDERLVPHVQRQLDEHGLAGRWFVGKRLSETRPFQWLAALRDFLRLGGVREFATLVRHPDVAHWLNEKGASHDWLTQLDRYCADHLPTALGDRVLGEPEKYHQVHQVHAALTGLLDELSEGHPRALSEWMELLREVLAEIYETVAAEGTRITAEACQRVADALVGVSSLPEGFAVPVASADAIELVLDQLAGESIPAEADPEAIEILGWLELPLDDAPALVVTSFCERFVPKSLTGDLFLPDGLRRRLDLDDNRRRYARDAYALDVLINTRVELRLIVSRRDTEGNPLAPSRLLFATDGDTIAQRVLRLYDTNEPSPRPALIGRFVSTRSDSDFTIPQPNEIPKSEIRNQKSEIATLRVTDFKTYLVCPYRFYLARVLGLERLDDRADELDALQFGGLIHDVLGDFGTSDSHDSHDPEQIADFLEERLQAHVHGKFGHERRPAVNVQIRQIRQRLRAFARWQAEWAKQGWQIIHVEKPSGDQPTPLDVDGTPINLAGRIDRIDRNTADQFVVFDYKSSAQGASPQETHRKKSGEWTDLQLPLYRHIAATLGVTGDVGFGYIVLPEDTTKTGARLADWTATDLATADEAAREVVRRIRRREFWPPAELPPGLDDDFAAICMEGVFEKPRPAAAASLGASP